MRKQFIFAAVILQFAILFTICGKREMIIRTGDTVFLRTAPVDPRDLFRGDYVILNYEISSFPVSYLKEISPESLKKGDPLYVHLKTLSAGSCAEAYAVSADKPASGLFIKGRVSEEPSKKSRRINLKYGIESYYVQQGAGIEMEKRMDSRRAGGQRAEEGWQTPLEMELSVGGDGTAVIKSFRWSPLAHNIDIGWKVIDDPDIRNVINITYSIKNVSVKDIALVNLPGLASFSVEPEPGSGSSDEIEFIPKPIRYAKKNPADADVIVLRPGEKRRFTFDFTDRKFYFKNDKKIYVSINTLSNRSLRFRIVYRSPSDEESAGLKKKNIIWHGHLPSTAFTAWGFID
jgi:uncharacterized membrane-anchored protein